MISSIFKFPDLLPPHTTLVELGGDGLLLLLTKLRSKVEVYNDEPGNVLNLCQMLRNPQTLQQLTDFIHGPADPKNDGPSEAVIRAARFFQNCQTALRQCKSASWVYGERFDRCFHGTLDYYMPVIQRWHGVQIENKPWTDLIERYDTPQTCFVVHPAAASVNDQELLRHLQLVQGKVLVCGPALQLMDKLPMGWSGNFNASHSASTLRGRDPAPVVWANYSLPR